MLRGPSRTVVRRWSPDTRLNGRNFTESELQAGDCLSIGAIDLEVVETAQPGLPSEDLRDQQGTIDQQLAQIEVRLRSLRRATSRGASTSRGGCAASEALTSHPRKLERLAAAKAELAARSGIRGRACFRSSGRLRSAKI